MQDHPPQNRAQRRAAQRSQKPAAPALGVRPPVRPSSRSAAPAPPTDGGAPSVADDAGEPAPPADDLPPLFGQAMFSLPADKAPSKAPSHHKGGGKLARIRDGLLSYYGFAGMLVSARNPADGMLIIARAQELTETHLEVAKVNPQYMRVLEVITTGGPYTALFLVHGKLAMDIMRNHGRSPLELFSRPATVTAPKQGKQQQRTDTVAPPPPPLPYQPAGPHAPTEAPPPPMPYTADELRVFPDEGLPAEVDVALRQMARQSGRPYAELRQEALVELAQLRMQQNGHIQQPGALGAPITRE